MRIGIREQLGLVVLVAASIPLIVLSLAVWFNNYNFVRDIKGQDLSLTASLKAEQVASDLLLIRATCETIVTRVILQTTIRDFYANGSSDNWAAAEDDISGALASGGLSALLQTTVFSSNGSGGSSGLLNTTAGGANIPIPGNFYPNGTQVMLGDSGPGYPEALYPNITYNNGVASAFGDYPLNQSASLVLGPLQINNTFALVSLTLPIIDNSNKSNILGFMTVIAAATSLINVLQSREGLGDTGIALIVGPNRRGMDIFVLTSFRRVLRPMQKISSVILSDPRQQATLQIPRRLRWLPFITSSLPILSRTMIDTLNTTPTLHNIIPPTLRKGSTQPWFKLFLLRKRCPIMGQAT